jgi:peroxiredoxin
LVLLIGCAVVGCAFGIQALIPEDTKRPPDVKASPPHRLGGIPNIVFQEASPPLALRDCAGKKGLVVVFLSFECPVCANYAPTLADLARTYGRRGVAFLGITTNQGESAAHVARRAREFNLPFPVVPDKGLAAARAFQAEVTPEVFVLDEQFHLRYRGRIDDSFAARLKKNSRIRREDLRRALDEVLAGKRVSRPATKAVGCPIPRGQTANKASGLVMFYRDVMPILQERCQGCHRPGEVGPFSLTTYRQALNWADDIKEYTRSRRMPPWKPVAGATFFNERKLTTKEIATLAAWVDGGAPAGDPKDAPKPKKFPRGWTLGKPDLILTLPDEFVLGPSGPDLYRFFVLPTRLAEDRYIAAVEVRPGNRRVVHHAILFVDRKGRARRLEKHQGAPHQAGQFLEKGDRGPGYSLGLSLAFLPGFIPDGNLAGWAPGYLPRRFPKGVGFFLPRQSDVVLQLHYHRTGRTEKDRTKVGLYFCKKGPVRRLQGVPVPAQFLFVPANAQCFRVRGSISLRQDCRLYAIMPHMHLLGRKIRVTMTPPGGKTRTLVAVNDWDFNWQETYYFKKPIVLKAGTQLTVAGTFDNSAGNPNNPNRPPRTVFFGLQSTNEMCVGFLGVAAATPGPIRFDVQMKIPGVKVNFNLPFWGL